MRHRRLARYHGLKRPRVRLTWNKYNLFNLARLRINNLPGPKTFFQQKWYAKSLARAYHGEHIKEFHWERMFSRRIRSVVNMDPGYMARHDGSELAEGRGSGKILTHMRKPREQTPHMQMTFAPMERRLDIAVFRAMFASSARQARQFVVHGSVKVNGKKMVYPGYLLNPGDMFQVDMDKVHYATGLQKPKKVKGEEDGEEAAEEASADDVPIDESDLMKIEDAAKKFYEKLHETPKAERQSAFRELINQSRILSSAPPKPNRWKINANVDQLTQLMSKLNLNSHVEGPEKALRSHLKTTIRRLENEPKHMVGWQPRPFIAPFAFIPRYLEVNQKICAAVYLRHPVARPGSAEVPTPFPRVINELAFNWYLRRG